MHAHAHAPVHATYMYMHMCMCMCMCMCMHAHMYVIFSRAWCTQAPLRRSCHSSWVLPAGSGTAAARAVTVALAAAMSGLPRRRTDSAMTDSGVGCGSSCCCTRRQCYPPGYSHSGCRSSAAAAAATAMSGLPRWRTCSAMPDNRVDCGSSCCCTTCSHSRCRFLPAHGAHLRQVLTATLLRRCTPRAG